GVAGGIAIGFVISWCVVWVFARLDDIPLEILLSVLMGYASFAIAEAVGASGVLAAVTGGLYLGWRSPEVIDGDTPLNAQAFWRVLIFALNAVLFILLGMQFPDVLRTIGQKLSVGEIIGYGLLVSGVVIAVRIAWQFLPVSLERLAPALGNVDTGE